MRPSEYIEIDRGGTRWTHYPSGDTLLSEQWMDPVFEGGRLSLFMAEYEHRRTRLALLDGRGDDASDCRKRLKMIAMVDDLSEFNVPDNMILEPVRRITEDGVKITRAYNKTFEGYEVVGYVYCKGERGSYQTTKYGRAEDFYAIMQKRSQV